ncbi:hypothetical protein MTO96_022831 [Rhipicephalus appendiculatus]
MFTNVDVRGVPRGRCGREQCECDGFTRSHTGAYGGASGWVHSGWCCYCGHPPVNHSRIERNVPDRQEILPVIWNGARTPMLDLPTHCECNGMLEAAQPMADEVIVLEPDEVRETAAPENETPEGIVQHAEEEQSDQNLGLKRKHSREDAPDLDTSTLKNSGLLQKVENLENEVKELKKHQKEQAKLSKMLSTSLELVQKFAQLLPQQQRGLKNNTSKKSPKGSPNKRPRSTRSSLRNRQSHGTANCSAGRRVTNDSSLVKIGKGVSLKKKQLEEIWKKPKLTATKFVRQLCRAVFTPQELQGKCLKNTGPNGSKQVLDPIRLNVIIEYTRSKFDVDRHDLRLAICDMLAHWKKRTTPRL